MWLVLDPPMEEGRKWAVRRPWVMVRLPGMVLGILSECWAAIIGKEAACTQYGVSYTLLLFPSDMVTCPLSRSFLRPPQVPL